MSFFAAYLVPGTDEPVDGDSIATTFGWHGWTEWVLGDAEQYPEAAHLAQEGWVEGGESLTELEHELNDLLHVATDRDLSSVTAQVLAALKSRPAEATALMVTDGEPSGEDGEV